MIGDCGHAPSGCPEDCHALDGYRAQPPPPRDPEALLRQANEAFRQCDDERERTAIERESWKSRALALEAALADAEARGRAHGLLAAAWTVPECRCGPEWTVYRFHDPQCAAWVRDDIELLAAEATRDE